MLHKNRCAKVSLCFLLACLMLLLTGCESKPLTPSEEALTVVGTVGGREVLYEELYFLTELYGGALEGDALREKVNEEITANHAVLILCAEAGIPTDSDELDESVQCAVDQYIESSFGGDRKAYLASLREMGATDHYIRFCLKTDLLYAKLKTYYLDQGIFSDDEDEVREEIEREFVRTTHVMILNDNGNEKNLARAEEALSLLESGKKTMYSLIGSTYNEDLQQTTLDGYYFTRGMMDEAYEAEAFSLKENEISGVVASKGKNSVGDTVDCFYIIQRLPLEDTYLDTHFETLRDDLYDAKLYAMVEEVRDAHDFAPNNACHALDLSNMDAPRQTDTYWIAFWCALVLGVLLLVGGAILCVILVRRHKKKIVVRALQKRGQKHHG